MWKKFLALLIFLLAMILLLACQPSTEETAPAAGHSGDEAAHAAAATPLPGWSTYHNEKYAFLLVAPPGWQVMETPNTDYPTASEQVWLSAESFAPFSENVLPDILVTIFHESPASRWEPQYFNDYRVELMAGEMPVEATYITGVSKATGARQEVVIARLPGGVFLELQRSGVDEMSEIFNQLVRTLRPAE